MHSPLYLRKPDPRVGRNNPRRIPHSRTCHKNCPGAEPCCLNAGVPHTLHICSNPRCICHYRERYDGGYNE